MQVYDENIMIYVCRKGKNQHVPFYDVREGDYIPSIGAFVTVGAHESGDSEYNGWLFYDTDGEGWFPEDFGAALSAK